MYHGNPVVGLDVEIESLGGLKPSLSEVVVEDVFSEAVLNAGTEDVGFEEGVVPGGRERQGFYGPDPLVLGVAAGTRAVLFFAEFHVGHLDFLAPFLRLFFLIIFVLLFFLV